MSNFPTIAIYNDPSSGEKDNAVQAIVAALQVQVDRDFQPYWNTRADLVFVPSSGKPPAGAWVIALLSNSDVAGALGYHDLTPDGLPLGKVFAATDRQFGQQVSVTLSHELLEMLGDPDINRCVQLADGRFAALETADAVEADVLGYQIDGVTVSDFLLPAYFAPRTGPGATLDFREHLSAGAPALAQGGYISIFDPAGGQGWSQVTADRTFSDQQHRPRVGSRRERRFTPRAQWVASTYPIN